MSWSETREPVLQIRSSETRSQFFEVTRRGRSVHIWPPLFAFILKKSKFKFVNNSIPLQVCHTTMRSALSTTQTSRSRRWSHVRFEFIFLIKKLHADKVWNPLLYDMTIVSLVLKSHSSACPRYWDQRNHNCYFAQVKKMTWKDAQQYCRWNT